MKSQKKRIEERKIRTRDYLIMACMLYHLSHSFLVTQGEKRLEYKCIITFQKIEDKPTALPIPYLTNHSELPQFLHRHCIGSAACHTSSSSSQQSKHLKRIFAAVLLVKGRKDQQCITGCASLIENLFPTEYIRQICFLS